MRKTGKTNLCLAGGVALNCVANGRILREGPFKEIWIRAAAGDAGGSLGAALAVWHQMMDQPRDNQGRDTMRGALLGPEYTDAEIAEYLESVAGVAERLPDLALARGCRADRAGKSNRMVSRANGIWTTRVGCAQHYR